MAVNQSGRVSATTSVAESGSILLLAQGGVNTAITGTTDDTYKRAQRSGELVLGAGSLTEVLPDDKRGSDGKALTSDDNATFVRSRVELAGASVTLADGAQVIAPGGTVNVRAVLKPEYISNTLDEGFRAAADEAGRSAVVRINRNAVIDVSGTTDTSVSAARNFVTTELLGSNDLKDAPLQRDGLLLRNRVTVDTRSALSDDNE